MVVVGKAVWTRTEHVYTFPSVVGYLLTFPFSATSPLT